MKMGLLDSSNSYDLYCSILLFLTFRLIMGTGSSRSLIILNGAALIQYCTCGSVAGRQHSGHSSDVLSQFELAAGSAGIITRSKLTGLPSRLPAGAAISKTIIALSLHLYLTAFVPSLL